MVDGVQEGVREAADTDCDAQVNVGDGEEDFQNLRPAMVDRSAHRQKAVEEIAIVFIISSC